MDLPPLFSRSLPRGLGGAPFCRDVIGMIGEYADRYCGSISSSLGGSFDCCCCGGCFGGCGIGASCFALAGGGAAGVDRGVATTAAGGERVG